jgi:hypothetical protein
LTVAVLALLGLVLSHGSACAGLLVSFQQTGNIDLEVAGVAGGNGLVAGGTLSLSRLPATAAVVKATLYASQVNNGVGLHAQFAGADMGTVGPAAADTVNQALYCYQWDVTSRVVPGVTSYSFVVNQGSAIAGVALAVVWEDVNEPTRLVCLMDGMRQLGADGPESQSVTFANLGPGATKVSLFTVLDDAVNSGEIVSYNGSALAGPIDQNLGFLASLLRLDTVSNSGDNTVSIWTDKDHMGWMIAGASVTMPPVGITPATWSAVKTLYH